MATLQELSDILTGTTDAGSLRAKIAVACLDRATVIVGEATPSAERKQWAQDMLGGQPENLVDEMFRYAVMSNDGLTVAQILGASDADIQTAVDTAVDKLYP